MITSWRSGAIPSNAPRGYGGALLSRFCRGLVADRDSLVVGRAAVSESFSQVHAAEVGVKGVVPSRLA